MDKILRKKYKKYKYIGIALIYLSAGMLAIFLNGKQLNLSLFIMGICIIGEGLHAVGSVRLNDKHTYIYTSSDGEIAATKAMSLNEAIENFSDFYEYVESQNVYLVTYSEIVPTTIIK